MASLDSLRKMLKLDPGNQDIIDKINKERDAKKPKHKGMGPAYKSKSSGGTVRLKKGKGVKGPASSAIEQMKSIPGHLKAVSKAKNKASGGVVRLKSGGPVVDSYDYS